MDPQVGLSMKQSCNPAIQTKLLIPQRSSSTMQLFAPCSATLQQLSSFACHEKQSNFYATTTSTAQYSTERMNGWTSKDQGARQDKTLGIWPIAFIVKAKLKQAKVKRYKLKLNSVLTFKSIQCTLYSVLICTTFSHASSFSNQSTLVLCC